MNNQIYSITAIFQIFVFLLTSYYLVLSLFGLYKKNNTVSHKAKKSFALIVAAHNEEIVVGKIVESLLALDYPRELYDVFVIADNCTDKTAQVAREHGATVFERSNKEKRGKGYALEWMFDKIFKMDKHYDGVAVFDADNLVSKNFLTEMNNQMCEGYKVVQGYIDSKNPNDSWITQAYSISFWSANRLFQLARTNLGLSNQIGGTGFVVDTDILKKLGWGATCLTEDLEFSCKLVLNGQKVGWAHEAVVYDEKPLTLNQSWNQRKRWMQGFADVASRFFTKLVKKAIKDRDFVALDCALYVIQPFVILLLGVSIVLTLAQNSFKDGLSIFTIQDMFNIFGVYKDYVWKIFSVFQFLLMPFVILIEKKISKRIFALLALYSSNVFLFGYLVGTDAKFLTISLIHLAYLGVFIIGTYFILGKQYCKQFIWFLLYGVYTLTWIPITIQGIMNKNNKEWSHTKHVRQIGIYEV